MAKEKFSKVTTIVTIRSSTPRPAVSLAAAEQNLNPHIQLIPVTKVTEALKSKCTQIAKAVIDIAKEKLLGKKELDTNDKEQAFISTLAEFFLSEDYKDKIAQIGTSQIDKFADQLADNFINNQVFKVEANCCCSQHFTIEYDSTLGGIINYSMQASPFE